MTAIALPRDENHDIVLRQPSVGRLATALRKARRERRFVTVVLNARAGGLDLEIKGRFSWLSEDPKSVRRYAKRCLASLAKSRGADVAAVTSAAHPEHLRESTALKALNRMSGDPCPRTGRVCVWTDGDGYYVQQWSVAFPVGVEHLPEVASDEWWACAEFSAEAIATLRELHGAKVVRALQELRAMVRSRERGGYMTLSADATKAEVELRWVAMGDDTRRQLEQRLKKLRAPAGAEDDIRERARCMLSGERVTITRALKEAPDGRDDAPNS